MNAAEEDGYRRNRLGDEQLWTIAEARKEQAFVLSSFHQVFLFALPIMGKHQFLLWSSATFMASFRWVTLDGDLCKKVLSGRQHKVDNCGSQNESTANIWLTLIFKLPEKY